MSSFLYYKPKTNKPVTHQDIVDWGLDYAFDSNSVEAMPVSGNTPDGERGYVFADPRRMGSAAVRLDMQAQEWQELPGTDDLWVGMWRDEPHPGPADLARRVMLPGYEVDLGADAWQVPLVRRLDTAAEQPQFICALPQVLRCGRDGEFKRSAVQAVHAHLWELTTPIADALLAHYVDEAPLPDWDDEQVVAPVVTLLATNYVVRRGELSLLGVLEAESLATQSVALVSCDWPTFQRWAVEQKKSGSPLTAAG